MADLASAARARLHNEVEEDRATAIDTWNQAEKALTRALKDAEKRRGVPSGQTAEGARVQPPLRKDPSQVQNASPSASPTGTATGALDAPHWDEDARAARNQQRAARVSAARDSAARTRQLLMVKRASDTRDQLATHGKRKLRAKIVAIIQEVQRRQALEHRQAERKKFREDREKSGQGPASYMGDADTYALGLVGHGGKIAEEHTERGASPRRSRILEALALDELQMLRCDPWFFFESPLLQGSADGRGSMEGPDDSLEGVIDFFTPTKEDKNLNSAEYAQKLRAQLEKEAAEAAWLQQPEKPPERKRPGEGEAAASWDPQARAPCQVGRRPIRDDARSPTLTKVREVYNRREEQDTKWLEDKREAMMRRINLNNFKAKEQQRESQMQAMRQKELHKVHMLEAQERRAEAAALAEDSINQLEMEKHAKLIQANNKAEDMLEAKRDRATAALDHWYEGVVKAEDYLRTTERKQVQRAEDKWNKYVERLWVLGQSKHNAVQSHAQKNDDLKSRIQSSLQEQLAGQHRERAAELSESMEARLAAAAERRRIAQKGGRYGFLERAFGDGASGFDVKFHAVQTDRRSPAWRTSSEAWARQSSGFGGTARSLSEPALAAGSSPPGGRGR